MVLDSLENSDKYTSLHPLFAKAFEWIRSQNLNALEVGKFDIAEGLKAAVSSKPGYTAEEAKFECHNNYMDIQVCLAETETLGWSARSTCANPAGEYNPEKDVLFFNDQPGTYFNFKKGQFTIFFPEDVHAPMIGEGDIKKLVVKIKI